MMYGYTYGDGGSSIWMMLVMAFFWLVFIVGLLMLIGWAVMSMRRGPMMHNAPMGQMMGHKMMMGDDEAMSILKTRYAKGEITKQQFEQMKKDLQ